MRVRASLSAHPSSFVNGEGGPWLLQGSYGSCIASKYWPTFVTSRVLLSFDADERPPLPRINAKWRSLCYGGPCIFNRFCNRSKRLRGV
ncbi:hypothetical protein SCP_0505600 [Sparassis crispa]|uniref:Uncharacterized protein n=1 Tax=Sparassis crispa TaxID=139825 RepID=A0A401GMW1_9APHY|nr:hypothetical protein SCP_0505600 [Sparassis crispa]GBE83509.1 hypothetical protein SCP_0505600 [Sparassis crispa]